MQTSPQATSWWGQPHLLFNAASLLECGAVSFVNSWIFFPTQNKTNQIVPEFTVDLRGATIGWASKDKSSKKNVLEVCSFVDMEHNIKCAF